MAHAFKWNAAGRVNAIGVHERAPLNERNLLIFCLSDIVKQTVNTTSNVLVKFLVIYLFLDFGHDL